MKVQFRKKAMSDHEIVEGLQRRDQGVEETFYRTARRYFMEHFHDEFFDKDAKEEIFQDSFVKLWTEITSNRICLHDDRVARWQKDGQLTPLTCSLTTFLMAIARNEYREVVRDNRVTYVDQYFDDALSVDAEVFTGETEDANERRQRIVAECITHLSPSCTEILTLFYYEGKSLDEIMMLREDQNSSKDGLKTRKNKCMNALREKITKML